MLRIINTVLIGACLLPLVSYGFIEGYVSNGCTPGTWTEDVGKSISDEDSARWYANKKKRFFIWVIEAEGGCAYCSAAANRIWNTTELKGWAKDNDIPLVVGNYSKMTYAASEFISIYNAAGMGAPVMAIVDGADGKTIFGYSSVRSGTATIGMGTTAATYGGEGFLIDYMNGYLPGDLAKYYINKADDTPNEVIPNSKVPFYGTKPHKITPAKEGKTPKTIGLWKDWEKNSLNSKAYLSSSGDVHVQSDDRQDWYKFTNEKSGQGYIVKCPTLSDKKGLGWLVVCTNSATAKKVCKAKKESEIKKYSHFIAPMSDLKSDTGVGFVAPKKGTVYLAFWRRPAKAKENITLNYTFTIQEGVIDAFYFDKKVGAYTYNEYETTNSVHAAAGLGDWVTNDCNLVVYRVNSETETEVSVQFDANTARRNSDYLIDSDSKIVTVKFAKDKKTAKVPFKIISQKGLWKGDRDFTASIVKDGKEGAVTKVNVTINELDEYDDGKGNEPDSASAATNLVLSIGISTNRLNAADTKDWFKLPPPSETNFFKVSVPKFAANKSSVALKYGIYDGDGNTYKTNDIDASTVFNVPPAWYVLPACSNLYLKVWRSPTDTNDISCVYQVKLEEAPRPGVTFKNTALTFDSPTADTNVTFELDIRGEWAFNPLPEVKADDVTATNGLDYAFVDGEIATNGVIGVTLKNNVNAWRPERKFSLKLSADKNGFYYIPGYGNSLELTLEADSSEPADPVELQKVPEIPVGETFMSYDDRNLNNTNTTDTLYFHVTNGVDYVLAATDVVTKPADAATNITVTVYTNLSSVTANVIHEETYGPAVTNWYSIVTTTNLYCEADGSTVTNSIDIVETNAVDFAELESTTNWWITAKHWNTAKIVTTTETDPTDISVTNTVVTTNWTHHVGVVTNSWTAGPAITNYFTVFETATNIATRTQRKPEWTPQDLEPCVEQKEFKVAEGAVATNTYITVTITNDCKWVPYDSWTLSEIADPDTMPLLNFLEAGDIKVDVSRDPDPSVMAEYSLGLSQWKTTTVEFARNAWTNMQNEAALLDYTLVRSGDTQLKSTAYVTLTCGTARDGIDVTAFEKKAVTFDPGATETSVSVANLMAETPGIWKGDRSFSLSLSVEDAKLSLGAVSNATVVLKSHLPEYEDGDSDDERSSRPAVTNALSASWAEFRRTMNGADDKDCFLFTDIKGGVRYRFSLELADGTTNNLENVGSTFYTNGCWAVPAVEFDTWDDLLGKNFDFTPADGVTNITVKLARESSAEPASMGYVLKAREWPWPTFDFATTEAEIDDSVASEVVISVVRTNNDELTNEVDVVFTTLTNTVVSGYSPTKRQRVVFIPGQASTNVIVTVVAGPEGVWTGDWAFKAELSQVKDDESRLGTNTAMTVVVKDADGEFDDRDKLGDDSWRGVLTNELTHSSVASYAMTFDATLHGSDNVDWYCFTNVVSNALYYVAAEIGGKAANVVDKSFEVDCYQAPLSLDDLVGADVESIRLESRALTNDMFRASSEYPILVRVRYDDSEGPGDVRSLPYTLTYRKVDAYVYLGRSEVTVEETSPGFYLDVICEAGDIPLSAPVEATITPETLSGDTATSPEDFDGRSLTVGWEAGSTGSLTNRVFIPLTNYDSRWEAPEETFHVTLAVDSGAGYGEITQTKVTIDETDPDDYGTVAITGAGDPLKEVTESLTLSTYELDQVQVRLTRKGGVTGDVVTRWYWKDEDNKTVKYASNGSTYTYHVVTNFFEGVDGSVTCMIPVPMKDGYQKSQKWTLRMKMGADCETEIADGSPTSIKFNVKDADYGGKISAYSADDPTKVVFSGSKWYAGPNRDSVRSTHPADGKSVTMSATVTGPGWLVFDAELEDVEKGYLKVTGGLESLTLKASAVSNRVEIAPGNRKLKFTFKRSKYDPPTAAVAVSNVSFEPGPTFNAYGTFTGPVDVDGVIGLATLSIGSSGKASGKFSVGKTWNFSNKDGWSTDDWTMAATAKYGSGECPFIATNDLTSATVALAGEKVRAPVLMRNVWKDKPLSAEAADLIEAVVGEHQYSDESRSIDCLLVVKSNGSVTISGIVSGKSVSFSRTLWMIDDKTGIVWIDGNIYLELTVKETDVEINKR